MIRRLVVVFVLSLCVSTACVKQRTQVNANHNGIASPTQAAPSPFTKNDLAVTVKGIVGKQLDTDPNSIDVKVPLQKLGADELDIVEIILELEVQLNISIRDDELGNSDSYKTLSTENLIDIVLKKKLLANVR